MSRLITEEAVYEYLVSKFDEFDISIFGNEFAGKILDGLGDIPTIDEKEIIRKPMERIKERIDEKMESVDYWTKPFDKYEYYDNGFWEGMNEVTTIVKEEGGIE